MGLSRGACADCGEEVELVDPEKLLPRVADLSRCTHAQGIKARVSHRAIGEITEEQLARHTRRSV